jgi:signal transduction histidine kinase
LGAKVNFVDKVLSRIGQLDRESVQGYVAGLVRDKQEMESILDHVNEGILLVDREGLVRYANRRAFLWLGFQRFLKDRSPLLNLAEDPIVMRFVKDCLKNQDLASTEEVEVLIPREMPLRLHWIPLEGEAAGTILLRVENLGQEKTRADEEARRHRIEGLIRLAAGVAHEIGNPLNAIQIHLELLKKELAKLPKAKQGNFRKFADVLVSETRRLDQTVRSFLRATRRPPLRFRKESLNELLEGAIEFLRPEFERQNIQSRLSLETTLPSFLLDRDRLHQAFLNLIKNAMEAMTKGGELRISTKIKEKVCFVRFEDEGEGIDEQDLPHIFEAYYTTKNEGAGLGLSQVYEAVREHGGRIDVKSTRGKGSVFTLALPVREEKLSLPQPKRPSEEKKP